MKPFNDYFEYRIAGNFLPALINGDLSGLDDDEVNQFDQWIASTQNNAQSYLFNVVDEESSFAHRFFSDFLS